jgi:hypothetical protein
MATGETGRFMAMKGAGYYSKATTGAKHAIDGATSLVLDAIGRMDLADDGAPFRAADMGAADGGTSVEMWRQVLKEVRRRAPGGGGGGGGGRAAAPPRGRSR